MGLRGLQCTTWTGWLIGLVILRTPWGPPTLPSWSTFSLAYSITLLLCHIFLIIDVVINSSNSMAMAERNRLGILVTIFGIQELIVTYFYFRLCFLINAKKIANFMRKLHYYPLPSLSKFWRNKMVHESVLTGSCVIFYLIASIVGSIAVSPEILGCMAKQTWVGYLTGHNVYIYGTIISLFMTVPPGLTLNIVLGVVVSFSYRLARIFENFSEETILAIRKALRDEKHFDKVQQKISVHQSHGQLSEHVLKTKCFVHETLIRFLKVQELCESGLSFMSPLLFGLLFLGTTFVITCISKLVILPSRSTAQIIVDISSILQCWGALLLIPIGETVNKIILKGKLEVYQEYRRLPSRSLLKKELRGAVELMQGWQWHLAVKGFFRVDRSLTSGVSNT